MHLLGRNEWGLRFPLAVALVLAALAVGGIARTFWGKEPSRVAALAYATSLGPFLAANVLTPDTLLAATVAGFYYGYVRAEAAASSRGRVTGWLLAGLAAGLGLLAKGPALLLWAAPVPVHLLLRRRLLAALRGPGPWLGAIVALSVGLPWFLWISRTLPGAWSYILDSEVVGRLATGTYQRNAGTFGGFKVYLPTLLALSLPWGPIALYVWRRRRGAGAASPAVDREGLRPRALLWLWVFLPLAVLWAASSRLPLYALPMSGALALAAARALSAGAEGRPWRGFTRWRPALLVWCGFLLAIKGGAALWPADRDSRAFAREVAAAESAAGGGYFDIVAVDADRRALAFYLRTRVELVSGFHDEYPFYARLEHQAEEIEEARTSGEATLFIFQREHLDLAHAMLAAAGLACEDAASSSRRHAIVVCRGGSGRSTSPDG